MNRDVSSRLVLDVVSPTDLVLAIAVASSNQTESEELTVSVDGRAVDPVEIEDAVGTRLHRVHADPGTLTVAYRARVTGTAAPIQTSEADLIAATRPSRYAESDALFPTARAQFGSITDPVERLIAVSSWVGTQLSYVPGSSLPTDGATQTWLHRQGVCRDYAHLTAALLRALDVPARIVSAYAPGLSPMDFHAVVEAWVAGAWHVVDTTLLAPRQSLVRIATGRDAADTAFLTTLSGEATLQEIHVQAVADALPTDDIRNLVQIA